MPDFTELPIPYTPIGTQAAAVRSAIDAARLSGDNSFGGLQNLAIRGPFLSDAEADTNGVPVDNLYYQPDGTVRAASHLSLDLQFATDKTLTARVGPTPVFSRGTGATYVGSDGLIHGIDTSTSSLTVATGTQSVTLAATAGQDQMWRTGDAVEIVNAAGASGLMVGTVTSYTASTQVLVCNITSITGSGTSASWRIGYRGPRFDHDPVSPFACKGLLIEEGGRENLFSSTNLNDWTAARVTKTAITGIGLTNQATTLTISEAVNAYISRGATLTNGVAYAISVRVKAGTVASFSFVDLIDAKYSRSFNLSTNQWAASGGASEFTNYTVTPNIDGWFLVSAIYTPTGATGLKSIAFLLGNPVVGQTVSFDTPQIEVGSFPTSYIPTTTGTVARAADVCSISGSAFSGLYNQSEGTMVADVTPQAIAQLASVFTVNTTTFNNQNGIYKADAAFSAAGLRWGGTSVISGAPAEAVTVTSTDVAISRSKLSYSYKLNDFAFAHAGTIVGTDTGGALPSPTTMHIGNRDGLLQINGHLASIRYYKKRLPNAKLQALTV